MISLNMDHDAHQLIGGPPLGAEHILKNPRAILLIGWPSKDVPHTLPRTGFRIFVMEVLPEDYSVNEIERP